MGQKKELTSEVKAQIDILHQTHPDWNFTEIAKAIGRSRQSVSRYLANPQAFGTSKRSGRPKVTSPAEDRLIARTAKKEKMSVREIKSDLNLTCSSTTVWNRLVTDPTISFGRHKSKPTLTAAHKKMRLDFAIRNLSLTDSDWENIIWSDEKKWNLDGPDGLRSYWFDLRSEKTVFSRRHSGGGGVLTWAGFAAKGCTPIVFNSSKMNADGYQDILAENLLPFGPLITTGDYVFMHDNAPPHRAISTKSWLEVNEVKVMSWPPYSPDLNPIENLWGWLVRKVYAHGHQFRTVSDLKIAILNSWSQIPQELTQTLAFSVKERLIKVVQNNGGSINY